MTDTSIEMLREPTPRTVARAQGIYFLLTGIWPLLHLRSFAAVTGPKPEGWLVKMVGLLAAAIGGTLLSAAWRSNITPEIRGLAIGSALSFAAIDLWYGAKRRISPIYLADAVVEIGIVGAWMAARTRLPSPSPRLVSVPDVT